MPKKINPIENERFNKIFVFDINPGNDDITKDLIMGKLARVVKNASIYQFIILVSHANLVLLKKLATDIGIKNGYIVSDSGARIYDIMEDKIIFDRPMAEEDVRICVHAAIMQNFLVLASSNTKEYAYGLNVLNANSLNKKHYLPLSHTNEYPRFEKFISTNQIYSILCYLKDLSSNEQKREVFQLIKNNLGVTAFFSQSDYLSITSKSVSKFNAVLKIMELTSVTGMNAIYYYGLNIIDDGCFNAFKNRIINMDVAIRSQIYVSKLESHADINGLIENIKIASNIENKNDDQVRIFDAPRDETTIDKKIIETSLKLNKKTKKAYND